MKHKLLLLLPVGFLGLGIALMMVMKADATVYPLPPTGDTAIRQWAVSTVSTSTPHYTLVDEVGYNGSTDYVRSATSGYMEMYQVDLSSIPNGATVTNVAVQSFVRNDAVGLPPMYTDGVIQVAVSSSAITYWSPTTTLQDSYATHTFSQPMAFVKTATSSLMIGVRYVSGFKGARLSAINALITYAAVYALPPTADTAIHQWATSTSTVHYALVDEVGYNGSTDYVRSATSGQMEMYVVDLSSVPNGATVTNVAVRSFLRNDNILPVKYPNGIIQLAVSSSAITYWSPDITLQNSYATETFSQPLAFVKGSTSTLMIGIKHIGGLRGARMSAINALLTY